VRIIEVSSDAIRVKREDGGDINVPMLDFTLPFPVSDRLRPVSA
jgi:hypothetical protein